MTGSSRSDPPITVDRWPPVRQAERVADLVDGAPR
jgi:hypothetical protein